MTAGTRAFAVVVDLLERRGSWRPDHLAVLTYHRVDDPAARPGLFPGLISATPGEFAEQMAFIARRYWVLGAADVLDRREGGPPLPPPALLLTFDDAYADFAEHAWPTLRRLGLPATLFVPTAFPDAPSYAFWWDRLHQALRDTQRRDRLATPAGTVSLATEADRRDAFSVLRAYVKSRPHDEAMAVVDRMVQALDVAPASGAVLGWSDLRRLAADGVTLAAHSRHHPILPHLTPAQLVAELQGSRADLEREIGPTLPILAYPSGAVSDAVAQTAEALGFRVAFTTERGTNDLGRPDWLKLRRINVGRNSPLGMVRLQLVAWAGRASIREDPRPAP